MSGLLIFGLFLCCGSAAAQGEGTDAASAAPRPNVVLIFCDDLGYGDLGCFGHPTIATPNLDRMAREGTRFTQFYVAAPVCTPSRAALMTGRLPVRNGMAGNRRVLFPDSVGGLPADELTVPEVLREAGYATAMFGKWHLGHRPEYLPTEHGFDRYLGIPYSNDMDKREGKSNRTADPFGTVDWRDFDVPLLSARAGESAEEIERPADQTKITSAYAAGAAAFMRQTARQDRPFFVYLAHSMPHIPLFRSGSFEGVSPRGTYGDVITEIDATVGLLASTADELGLKERTLFLFTSDNGPWLIFDQHGGSAGLLRNGKGTTWEGGVRVPALAYWPGTVPPARTEPGLMSTMDILPTLAELAGSNVPSDRTLDGKSQVPLLTGGGPSRREVVHYYRRRELFAVRRGPWKAHFITQGGYGREAQRRTELPSPELYHLEVDPSEKYNVADQHPEIVGDLTLLAEEHLASFEMPPSQLDRKQ